MKSSLWWVAGVLLPVVLGGCMPAGDEEPALALADIAAADGPSSLKQQTPTPRHRAIVYRVEGRRYDGDVYLSPDGSRAGLVLVPGVVPAGKDDPRLVALANTLARLGFAVLVPDIRGLRRYQVRHSDVGAVADAFRHLLTRPAWVPQGRAGIVGFSYGAGPVLLAGLQPDIREQVRFILTLGGYHDLRAMVAYFTTGYYRMDAQSPWQYRAPSPYATWVFVQSNLDLLQRPADRLWMQAWLRGRHPSGEQQLAADTRALLALLRNRDPEQVPRLITALSPRIRAELDAIDPATHDLSALHAQLILVHGRSDDIIPYTESLAMARALPARQVQLFLIEGFAHVDVRPTQQDIPHLKRAMAALLAQRALGRSGEL